MSVRIGVGVGSSCIRAVLVRKGVIVWRAESAIAADDDLAATLKTLLADAPLPRRGRAPVVAAIGPVSAQTKQLAGLPTVANARVLDQIVRQSAPRFFLAGASTLTTTPVWHARDGSPWCAAFETPVLRAIATACSELRLSFVGAVPAAVAVGRAAATGEVCWRDGAVVLDVVAPNGAPQSVRRHRGTSDESSPPAQFVQPLASLGADACRFADAYGAVLSTVRAPLFWRAVDARHIWPRQFARAALVALTCFAALGAVAGPGVRARLAARSARQALAGAAPAMQAMARVDRDLRVATGDIDRIERFASGRRSMSRLMMGLAQSLPESTAVVSLRVDTAGATMVTLSRRAADIIPQLREVDDVATSQIVGSATRELLGAVALERATIRFTFDKRTSGAASSRRRP